MSAGLFRRLFAAADGGLGSTRVRPQTTLAWTPEGSAAEAPAPAASPAGEHVDHGEALEGLPRATSAAPGCFQPLRQARPAVDARSEAAASSHPAFDAASALGTPSGQPAPASLQAIAVSAAPVPLPKPRAPLSPAAAVFEAKADTPPPLLQAPRHADASAAPPPGRAAAIPRARPTTATAAPADEPTIVHVSIGRVEFVAAAPAAARPRPAPRASPRVPLADYLSGKAR